MENYICRTCGVEHAASESPPARCLICEDERQYVGWDGQQWTTMAEMKTAGYRNEIREEEPGLTGIGIDSSFSIGQRALLVQTDQGNILYDCISYLDDEAISAIRALGEFRPYASHTRTFTTAWLPGATRSTARRYTFRKPIGNTLCGQTPRSGIGTACHWSWCPE